MLAESQAIGLRILNVNNFEATREYAKAMDATDSLAEFREQFNMPIQRNGLSCIYLCGNSLGLQPKLATQFVNEDLQDWGDLGVAGHVQARRPYNF